jgi:putative tryptophan/tyrosine transport system substrate-binding protein
MGWFDGGNVQLDERWSTSNMDLGRADAANLVALNPDVILIASDRVIPVLAKLTGSIPIVVALTSDPNASGAVESLTRPGRNVTGFSLIAFSIFGKMLEKLKQLAPGISRVGMMYNPDNPVGATYLREFEMVTGPLSVQPIDLPIHDLADIERAIASLAEQSNGGVLIPPDVTIFSLRG